MSAHERECEQPQCRHAVSVHDEHGCAIPDCKCARAYHDAVNHPAHYTSSAASCSQCGKGIECIDVVRHLGFNVGNAIKYLWRADLKGAPVEDLKKAIWYISDEIEKREAAT